MMYYICSANIKPYTDTLSVHLDSHLPVSNNPVSSCSVPGSRVRHRSKTVLTSPINLQNVRLYPLRFSDMRTLLDLDVPTLWLPLRSPELSKPTNLSDLDCTSIHLSTVQRWLRGPRDHGDGTRSMGLQPVDSEPHWWKPCHTRLLGQRTAGNEQLGWGDGIWTGDDFEHASDLESSDGAGQRVWVRPWAHWTVWLPSSDL